MAASPNARLRTVSELVIGGQAVAPGERREVALKVSEDYSGAPVVLPITVWRGPDAGPTVFIAGAVHGDELNGTGIVRELILRRPFALQRGSLVLAPVINMLGFERHMRYLPDRRDLNRSFPGSASGSLTRRIAFAIFTEIIRNCDYGIDLHSAAVRRTNFPNVRGDLRLPEVDRIAGAFGCALIISGEGPKGSLRRSACQAGCATIILEAGEVWKVEPTVVECGLRGIRNVLIELGMVNGRLVKPPYQARVEKTKWIRADVGGFLQFHVAPGDVVDRGQPLATNTNLLGRTQNVLESPAAGVVLGMTTLPAVTPGDPVCQLAIPREGVDWIRRALDRMKDGALHGRMQDDLATSVTVREPNP